MVKERPPKATVETRVRLKDTSPPKQAGPTPKKKPRKPRANVPALLDDKLIEQFCGYIREGDPPSTACLILGIDESAFWKWCTKGRLYVEGQQEDSPPPTESDRLYGQFYREFSRAWGEYLHETNQDLRASTQYWHKYLAILSRRDPNTWAKNPMGGTPEQFEVRERFL